MAETTLDGMEQTTPGMQCDGSWVLSIFHLVRGLVTTPLEDTVRRLPLQEEGWGDRPGTNLMTKFYNQALWNRR